MSLLWQPFLVAGLVMLIAAACGGTSGASPVEVASQAVSLYEAGDIEGWQSLFAPDATWTQTSGEATSSGDYFGAEGLFEFSRQLEPSDWDGDGEIFVADVDARLIAEFHAAGGDLGADCAGEADGGVVSCELSPTSSFGIWSIRVVVGASPNVGTPVELALTIDDGQIRHMAMEFGTAGAADVTARQSAQIEYASWLQETRPGIAADLLGTSVGQLTVTAETYGQHRDLIAEWAAQG